MKHPLTGYHLRFCDEDLFSNLEKLSPLTVSNSQNVSSAVFYYAFLVVFNLPINYLFSFTSCFQGKSFQHRLENTLEISYWLLGSNITITTI